ncbi:extracellular solute-binding protein [Microlunatus sp. Gsoil 973]|jgi:multiple sugar transport system substrate-binding protein|nr:extracellular solute-binding protein [Microlunatus sp. Gsoil 973]
MNARPVPTGTTRRGLLLGGAAVGSSLFLGGCIGGGSQGSSQPTVAQKKNAPLTLQSDLADPGPKAGLKKVVDGYTKNKVTVNTVATEQFRAQLSTYLTSSDPPDVITWLAGAVARDYASKGYLLDVSDLWSGDGSCASFSPALKALSTDGQGHQIFVPTSYYWWSIFYRKSAFDEWGVSVPTTWDDFMALLDTLKGKGVYPLTCGTGSTAWMSSGWFDYLDLRINGAQFHRDLLAGKHSFDSAEVRNVMKTYGTLIPYFDPKGRSYSAQEAATPLANKKAAMYLIGAFVTEYLPKKMQDDIDFFSVPTIDPSIPSAEEAPTDGFFASSRTKNVAGTKDLLNYLASPEQQQAYIEAAGSSNLPTSPDVDTSNFSPLVQKGIKLLADTKEITQFFNRDSSDALQTTADTALTRFLDHPEELNSILKSWQEAATKVRNA